MPGALNLWVNLASCASVGLLNTPVMLPGEPDVAVCGAGSRFVQTTVSSTRMLSAGRVKFAMKALTVCGVRVGVGVSVGGRGVAVEVGGGAGVDVGAGGTGLAVEVAVGDKGAGVGAGG